MNRIRSMLTIARRLFLAAALTTTGCAGGEGTGPGAGEAGDYVLTNVDLHPPPATIHHGPWLDRVNVRFYNLYHVEITSGVLALDGDDRFVMTFNGIVVADGQQFATSVTTEGFYEVDGDEIWLTSDHETLGTAVGTLQGRTITFAVDFMQKGVDNEFVFQR